MASTIPLTRGLEAIVDDDLYEHLNQWKWRAVECRPGKFYAARSVWEKPKYRNVYMHRYVAGLIGLSLDGFIDHHDRRSLNNQSDNLREATRKQNQANRGRPINNKSGFKGVIWIEAIRKWRAQITADSRTRNLGSYDTALEAALAYDAAAKDAFGEFADLNNPQPD